MRVSLRGTRSRIISSSRDSGTELAKNGCPASENTPSSRTSMSATSCPSRSIAFTSSGVTTGIAALRCSLVNAIARSSAAVPAYQAV